MSTQNLNVNITARNNTTQAFTQVNRGLRTLQGTQRSMNAGLNRNRRAVQQFGFQMTDFATQVAGGQSAMLAFTQQGGQMLQFFGPAGAIAAAFLAVFGSLAIAFTRSGAALEDLFPLMGVLREQFTILGNALTFTKELFFDFVNIIVNRLDQLIITLAVVVGWFAVKWVVGMIAAQAATFSLVGALAALRAAMIRLGIPALLIALGYLIERFMTLVQVTGSVGEAFVIVGDLAYEVFLKIGQTAAAVFLGISAGAARLAAAFLWAFEQIAKSWEAVINGFLDGWNKVAAFIPGMEGMIADPFTSFSDTVGGAKDALNGFADTTGEKALQMVTDVDGVTSAWQRLTGLLRQGDAGFDIRDMFGKGVGDAEGGGGGGSSGSKSPLEKAADEYETIFQNLQKTVGESMLSGFKALTQGAKSFSDVALDLLSNVADRIIDILMTPVFNSLAGGIAAGIGGGLGLNMAGPVPSFAGGGFTGYGPRTGGLDGRGGKLALVHPNETVTDHTRGERGGGNNVTVNMTVVTPNAESFQASRRQIKQKMAGMLR